MSYVVQIIQRVGIDVDEEQGDHPGDGAALVDLAVLELELELPFAPYPSLVIEHGEARVQIEEVTWDHDAMRFSCQAESVWMQTRRGAEGIVETLVAGGFRPLESDHRKDETH